MGKITTVGIDLATNVFSVHAVDDSGMVLFRKTVTRHTAAAARTTATTPKRSAKPYSARRCGSYR